MFAPLSWALAFVAGVLSILSPCVLPLLPVVFGAASVRSRWGAVALGAGLTVSFTAVGLFVATAGFAIGLDAELFHRVGGAMMAVIGAILIIPALQAQFASAAAPLTTAASGRMRVLDRDGIWPQASLGGLIGLAWAPCVGPTLGAAAVLAAQGRDLLQVAATMMVFGAGAATPLVLIGLLSASSLDRWRGRIRASGDSGKRLLGVAMLFLGLLMAFGVDKLLEAWIVQASPAWLTRLTTAI